MTNMAGRFIRFLYTSQLRTQLILALIMPTLLVGMLIGWPLIESRRAVLLEREQRRAALAGETAAVLFTERLRQGAQTLALLADRQRFDENMDTRDLHSLTLFLAAARTDTIFDCLAIKEGQDSPIAFDGICPSAFTIAESSTFETVPEIGLVATIAAPMTSHGIPHGQFIGAIQIGREMIDAARRQQDLELSIIVDGQVSASSLVERNKRLVVQGTANSPTQIQVGVQTYLAYYTPLLDLNGRQVAWIEVLLPLAPLWAAQLNATLIIVSGTAAATVIAVTLGWFVARHLSHSVDRLRQAATAIGNGNLVREVTIEHGVAEIRELSSAIDRMRQQLAQSRRDLEAEKQRYADILESIDEAVLTLDANTQITSINRGGEMMLGFAREQAIGLPLDALIMPDDGHPLRLASIPRRGAMRIAVRTVTRPTFLISASCAAAQNRSEHILVLRDVSDDAALRQLKDAFLANITHELRAPLAAQIASLEILRDDDDTLMPAERRQMLDALHSGVQRLDVLIQNLLDSASIEAGYFRVNPEPCQIEPLVNEAATFIYPLLRQRHQDLTIRIDSRLPSVLADGRRMIQVFVNLLANASKFGPRGDTLIIEVHQHTHDQIRITIADHGPGVPESRRERLFERFVRPGVEVVQEQGAGLGLAIVKAIIDRHSGTVGVISGRTGGTTVFVTLPAANGGT